MYTATDFDSRLVTGLCSKKMTEVTKWQKNH